MIDYGWFYYLLFGTFTIIPLLMLYMEYRAHGRSVLLAIRCPVWLAFSVSSIFAFWVAYHYYPDEMGLMSIFVFASSLPLAIAAQELPAANKRPPTGV